MKKIFIPLFAILLWVGGCSHTKNTTQEGKMHISRAEYKKWTEPPIQNSDVPERGTDLFVTVEHWPQDATPAYIIYHNRKISQPEITDSTDTGTLIQARTIDLSTVLVDKRETQKTDLSDRLVYATAKGDTSFIEIEEWSKR